MSDYTFTDDMAEISGMHGAYEKACQLMVRRGLKWFDAHPQAKPEFKTYGDMGVIKDENADATDLIATMIEDVDPSGAMVHACIGVIVQIQAMGWDVFVEKMKKAKVDRAAASS